MQQSLSAESTILEITERYPSTVQVFVDAGFVKVADAEKRKTFGKSLTVAALATLRQLDLGALLSQLSAAAERDSDGRETSSADVTLTADAPLTLRPAGDISLSGLLPCPVRLPLLEAVHGLSRELLTAHNVRLGVSLAAAAVGADALTPEIAAVTDENGLPDVFISAGFESFFDHKNFARFKAQGVFEDVAPPGQNGCFGDLALRDPDRHFTMLGVVPAVFLVNRGVLGDETPPTSFRELLSPRFHGRVALPVGDFDLFNAVLIHVFCQGGEAAVAALKKSMLVSLHPSQTVGRFAAKGPAQPAVSIVPYFFSRLTMGSKAIHVVWPEDGAVLSPIFMLVRRNGHPLNRKVAELFTSKSAAEILAHRGLAPALHPEVDNRLPAEAKFAWIGWPFIREHDFGALIPRLRAVFDQTEGSPCAL